MGLGVGVVNWLRMLLRCSYASFRFRDAFVGFLQLSLGLFYRPPDALILGCHIFGAQADLSQLPMCLDEGRVVGGVLFPSVIFQRVLVVAHL